MSKKTPLINLNKLINSSDSLLSSLNSYYPRRKPPGGEYISSHTGSDGNPKNPTTSNHSDADTGSLTPFIINKPTPMEPLDAQTGCKR